MYLWVLTCIFWVPLCNISQMYDSYLRMLICLFSYSNFTFLCR